MNESSMPYKVTSIYRLVDHGVEGGEEVKTIPRSPLGWLLQMVMSVYKMGNARGGIKGIEMQRRGQSQKTDWESRLTCSSFKNI